MEGRKKRYGNIKLAFDGPRSVFQREKTYEIMVKWPLNLGVYVHPFRVK